MNTGIKKVFMKIIILRLGLKDGFLPGTPRRKEFSSRGKSASKATKDIISNPVRKLGQDG